MPSEEVAQFAVSVWCGVVWCALAIVYNVSRMSLSLQGLLLGLGLLLLLGCGAAAGAAQAAPGPGSWPHSHSHSHSSMCTPPAPSTHSLSHSLSHSATATATVSHSLSRRREDPFVRNCSEADMHPRFLPTIADIVALGPVLRNRTVAFIGDSTTQAQVSE